jgi:glycosyltransferase involved in cell wall biosynthesis
MRQTLDSVVEQSEKPAKWVIVDDGSTDGTNEILHEYADIYDWIEIVKKPNRGHRSVGPGVIETFYVGYQIIDPNNYEYLCKLDLDLRLPAKYFEILMDRMEADFQLGTCSGKSYVEQDGQLVSERKGDEMSLGMTKFYRTTCFADIGGFVHEVMWDGIDCHLCRMKGWKACSWDEAELRFVHLRPMGSSQQNIYVGRMRHGYGQYFMGTGFTYMIASSVNRMIEKPYVIGGLAMLWGWIKSFMNNKPRYGDKEFRKFLNRYQWQALFLGKEKAIGNIHESFESEKSK